MSTVAAIPAVGATPTVAQPAPATPPSAAFQALLERLQRLAPRADDTAAVADPDTLQQAMRGADASFQAAMDLRRQLEDAFLRLKA
jgi:hypothetical protein